MLNLYFWESDGEMTAAFSCKYGHFGMTFDANENVVRKGMDKKQLIGRVTETMDAVLHHGKEILDGRGNIIPAKLRDQEAIRHFKDPKWKEELANFYTRLEVKEIGKDEAKLLQLI